MPDDKRAEELLHKIVLLSYDEAIQIISQFLKQQRNETREECANQCEICKTGGSDYCNSECHEIDAFAIRSLMEE